MKAEELAYNVLQQYNPAGDLYYVFTPDEFKQFCEQLCREQREICATCFVDEADGGLYNIAAKITNAKMPRL